MSMVSTDPIADMLTRLRNAIAVNKNEISLPHSKVKESVARLLKDTNFISGIDIKDATVGKTLHLTIHRPDQNAHITQIQRLSKPGRRLYSKADNIPQVKNGRGIVIVSTSKGVMTGKQAKSQHLGGELICKVY